MQTTHFPHSHPEDGGLIGGGNDGKRKPRVSHIPTPRTAAGCPQKNHGRCFRPYRWVVVGPKAPPFLINAKCPSSWSSTFLRLQHSGAHAPLRKTLPLTAASTLSRGTRPFSQPLFDSKWTRHSTLCHPDRSVPGFPTTRHSPTATYAAFRKESRTKFDDATNLHRKFGGA